MHVCVPFFVSMEIWFVACLTSLLTCSFFCIFLCLIGWSGLVKLWHELVCVCGFVRGLFLSIFPLCVATLLLGYVSGAYYYLAYIGKNKIARFGAGMEWNGVMNLDDTDKGFYYYYYYCCGCSCVVVPILPSRVMFVVGF